MHHKLPGGRWPGKSRSWAHALPGRSCCERRPLQSGGAEAHRAAAGRSEEGNTSSTERSRSCRAAHRGPERCRERTLTHGLCFFRGQAGRPVGAVHAGCEALPDEPPSGIRLLSRTSVCARRSGGRHGGQDSWSRACPRNDPGSNSEGVACSGGVACRSIQSVVSGAISARSCRQAPQGVPCGSVVQVRKRRFGAGRS